MNWIISDCFGAEWVGPNGECRFATQEAAIKAAKEVVTQTVSKRLYVRCDAPGWNGEDDILVENG